MYTYMYVPMVALLGGAFSYERGTPVTTGREVPL